MAHEKKSYELSAQEAMTMVRAYPEATKGESEIAGAIFDQDEARTFLQWLCGPEAQAIGAQLRAQRREEEESSHTQEQVLPCKR